MPNNRKVNPPGDNWSVTSFLVALLPAYINIAAMAFYLPGQIAAYPKEGNLPGAILFFVLVTPLSLFPSALKILWDEYNSKGKKPFDDTITFVGSALVTCIALSCGTAILGSIACAGVFAITQ